MLEFYTTVIECHLEELVVDGDRSGDGVDSRVLDLVMKIPNLMKTTLNLARKTPDLKRRLSFNEATIVPIWIQRWGQWVVLW
ncbi:hypothetical protein FCV25MIE_18770 [Fagus crenata]